MKRLKWLSCCAAVVWVLVSIGGARAEENSSCKCAGETGSTTVAKIEEALRGPLRATGLEFVETPLEEVVNLLQEEYGIPVQIDIPSLEEIGLDPQEPVTIKLQNISLRSALRLMLQRLGLTYIISNEVLMITTPEEAESNLVNCVYDVSGLIDGGDFDCLIDVITTCVAADTWAENGGGNADIRPLKPELLVISQTVAVHEQIAELLDAIREMRKRGPTGKDMAAKPANEPT